MPFTLAEVGKITAKIGLKKKAASAGHLLGVVTKPLFPMAVIHTVAM